MPISTRLLWGSAPVTSENLRLEFEHLTNSINKILSNLGYTQTPTGAQIKARILALPDSEIDVKTLDGKLIADQLLKSSQDFIFETASGTTPFSATDNDTVTWSAFTLRFADGSVYAIATGNTGNISTTRLTYIYFDASISVTTLNVTTDYNEAVGKERLLSCVCQGTSDTSQYAFYVPAVGAFGINSTNIQANSITATQIAVGAVTAAKISVVDLSAIKSNMGSIDAGSIIVGTTNKLWLNSTADGNLRIGGSVYADAPFQVSAVGVMKLSNVAGANTIIVDPVGTYAFAAGPTGSPAFTVTPAGALTATSATITGAVTATSGTIAGLTISSTALTATAGGNTTIVSSGATAFTAGPTGSPTFTVTQAGALTATSATLKSSTGTKYIDISSGTANEMQFFEGAATIVRIGSSVFGAESGIIVNDGVIHSGRSTLGTALFGSAVGTTGSFPTVSDAYVGVTGFARSVGGQIGKGVFGTASGAGTNWAGYFDAGDVKIVNALAIGSATPGAAGTLSLSSTALVTNLNADLLDGSHASAFEPANANIQSHISSTSNPHSVTKSQVGLASVENTALSTWAGSANITTLGTIGTGNWAATAIPIAKGGTGATTASQARINLATPTWGSVLASGIWVAVSSGGATTTQLSYSEVTIDGVMRKLLYIA